MNYELLMIKKRNIIIIEDNNFRELLILRFPTIEINNNNSIKCVCESILYKQTATTLNNLNFIYLSIKKR